MLYHLPTELFLLICEFADFETLYSLCQTAKTSLNVVRLLMKHSKTSLAKRQFDLIIKNIDLHIFRPFESQFLRAKYDTRYPIVTFDNHQYYIAPCSEGGFIYPMQDPNVYYYVCDAHDRCHNYQTYVQLDDLCVWLAHGSHWYATIHHGPIAPDKKRISETMNAAFSKMTLMPASFDRFIDMYRQHMSIMVRP